jgi:hypothetical protein
LLWQVPLQVLLVPNPTVVTGLAAANTTFADPFT